MKYILVMPAMSDDIISSESYDKYEPNYLQKSSTDSVQRLVDGGLMTTGT